MVGCDVKFKECGLVDNRNLLLVLWLSALDQAITATALPTIVGEVGGQDKLPWVVTA